MKQHFLLSVTVILVFKKCNCHFWPDLKCLPYQPEHLTNTHKIFARKGLDQQHGIQFYLFTRKNRDCFQEVNINNTINLKTSNFNSRHPTRILIHDYEHNVIAEMSLIIKNAYLRKGNFNIVVVDWREQDLSAERVEPFEMVESVGEVVADFMGFIHGTDGTPSRSTYVIGHGIGAHIAASAARQSEMKVDTIFALDPTELVSGNSTQVKLKHCGARYVESIYTNVGFLGINSSEGHASFFPNFGRYQKGCDSVRRCSHSRAYSYFAESINTHIGFWSTPCKKLKEILEKRECTQNGKKVLMGGEPAAKKIGYFYVPTKKQPDFAKGLRLRLKKRRNFTIDYTF